MSNIAHDLVRGSVISAIELRGDKQLHIEFDDGRAFVVEDCEQLCCETRYMTCDDDLEWYAGRGARLLDVEVRDAPSVRDGDQHDVQFLVITTDKGVITCETHNEHNGFYCGFDIACSVVQP